MKFEKTGSKKPGKEAVEDYSLKGFSTSKMLWFVVRRHKFAIAVVLAVVGWTLYLWPSFPYDFADMVKSI